MEDKRHRYFKVQLYSSSSSYSYWEQIDQLEIMECINTNLYIDGLSTPVEVVAHFWCFAIK